MKVSKHKVKTKGRKSSTKTVTRNFSKRKSMRKQNRRRRRTRKMKKGGRKKTQKKRIKGGSTSAPEDDILQKKRVFLQSFFEKPSSISDVVLNNTDVLDTNNTHRVKLSLKYPVIVVSASESESPILKNTLPDPPPFDVTDIEIIHRAKPNGSDVEFDKSFKNFNLTPDDPNKGLKDTLERLHIENCKSFETIHTGTDETPSPALTTLYIKDCPSIKTLATLKLGSNAILNLHIENCKILETLFSMSTIVSGTPPRTLKRLVLKDCPNIVDTTILIEILSNCTTIEDVTLDCLGLGKNNENYSTIFNSINNCKKIKIKDPNLTTLNISDPPKANLTTLELDCANLTAITLSSPASPASSESPAPAGPAATTTLENKFPALTDLNLNNCNKLNLTIDFFKLAFIKSLTSLDLTGVQSVNDETLSKGLLESPKTALTSLSLQHCNQIQDIGVLDFENNLPNLAYLNISYITTKPEYTLINFLTTVLKNSRKLIELDMRNVIQNEAENFTISDRSVASRVPIRHTMLNKIIIQTQKCTDCDDIIINAKKHLNSTNITLEEQDVRTK